jgi:hypothetical protein
VDHSHEWRPSPSAKTTATAPISHRTESRWRELRPFDNAGLIYGSGDFDDAGDDFVTAFRRASEYLGQCHCRVAFDLTHAIRGATR